MFWTHWDDFGFRLTQEFIQPRSRVAAQFRREHDGRLNECWRTNANALSVTDPVQYTGVTGLF
jgi:hypothetical protein